MRSSGVMIMTAATLLVCCCAYSHQEQELYEEHSRGSFDAAGHKTRSVSPLSDGQLVRQVRDAHRLTFPQARRFELMSMYGGQRYQWPFMSPAEFAYYGEGLPKRNFDEIDRSNLDSFVKKRNFDEIDQTSMPFPSKRFDYRRSGDDEERLVPAEFDEIDLSGFPIGSKRG